MQRAHEQFRWFGLGWKVDAIKPYLDAGFDEVALVQIGAETQADFCAWAERELLPGLRSL